MSYLASTLSRRDLLLGGTALGAASLLAGCGGSTSPLEDTLPEAYRESHRLELYETEPVLTDTRAVAVRSNGDLLLATRTRRYDKPEEFVSDFGVVRYTNRAMPGQTRRETVIAPRTLSDGTNGVIAAAANDTLWVSRFFLDGAENDGLSENNRGGDLVIFDSNGTQAGTLTLQKTTGYQSNNYNFLSFASLSVSQRGFLYLPANSGESPASYADTTVLRWYLDGTFDKQYVGTSIPFAGGRVAVFPDGTPVAIGYDPGTTCSGFVRVLDGQKVADNIPYNGQSLYDNYLQTDAVGNLYVIETDYRRNRASGGDPPRTQAMIRKYSSTGEARAFFRLGDYNYTSLAVHPDGTIFTVSGGVVTAWERTR